MIEGMSTSIINKVSINLVAD